MPREARPLDEHPRAGLRRSLDVRSRTGLKGDRAQTDVHIDQWQADADWSRPAQAAECLDVSKAANTASPWSHAPVIEHSGGPSSARRLRRLRASDAPRTPIRGRSEFARSSLPSPMTRRPWWGAFALRPTLRSHVRCVLDGDSRESLRYEAEQAGGSLCLVVDNLKPFRPRSDRRALAQEVLRVARDDAQRVRDRVD